MDWLRLFSSVVRLVDLHDSDRELGNAPEFVREERPGRRDGVYLDIAIAVLDCLYKLEREALDEYLPFSAIYRHALNVHPGVQEVDVLYVLNVLRRPTEIWYIGQDNNNQFRSLRSEKRNTALIEKTEYADEYRLMHAGRNAIGLANAVKNIAYMEADALKILRAIEGGDFDLLPQFADDLIQPLRREILDIRDALEKINKAGAVDRYLSETGRFREVIENTRSTVQKTERELLNPDTEKRFLDWQEESDSDLTFESLHSQIRRVRQVLEIFNRLLLDLIAISSHKPKSAVPPPSFLALALHVVKKPISDTTQSWLIRQWGAMGVKAPFYSVLDTMGAIKVRKPGEQPQPLEFSEEDGYDMVSRIGRIEFLNRHGAAIAAALNKGPLRLSEAVRNGWCVVDEKIMVGDLIGVFLAPDTLSLNKEIRIALSDKIHIADLGAAEMLFNDLEISLSSSEERDA